MKRKKLRTAKPTRSRRAPSSRATPREAIVALVAANASALGLTLDPAWNDSIAFNLRLILQHAARVEEFALADDAEPAPVYHA